MLNELIDKYYQNRRKDKAQQHFYVSDGGKCQRAVYFSMKGYPKKEKEARVLRIFDTGDLTHQRLMRALFGIPEIRVIASEIDMPIQDLFHGREDAIISLNNKLYIVDFKSISDYKFKKLDAPEIPHQRQLQLYMHYFKVPQGIVLYENKNTQDLKEFELKYDYKLCKKIISEFENLRDQYIEQDIIPPIPLVLKKQRDESKSNGKKFPWECEYCDFREECNRVEKEAKE
ncbi:MAG: PD-(D/E)XK nuclease family protein [Patescibacteria group bacterium]